MDPLNCGAAYFGSHLRIVEHIPGLFLFRSTCALVLEVGLAVPVPRLRVIQIVGMKLRLLIRRNEFQGCLLCLLFALSLHMTGTACRTRPVEFD